VIARRLPAGLPAVGAVAVLFVPLGCSRAEEPAGSPPEAGRAASEERKPRARERIPAYGIQAWQANRLRRPDFGLIRRSGAGFYRFNLLTSSRDDREPPPVRTYDPLIAAAVQERVELLPVLMRSRRKVRSSQEQVAEPPEGPLQHAEWRRRVRFFAERYGPGGSFWSERSNLPYRPIRIWEVWNEPNIAPFWDGRRVDPREYGRLLRETRDVLRAVDPGARIVSGGIASRHSGAQYLGAALDAAGPCSVDALSIHPYAPTVERAMQHLTDARAVADSRGLRDVPLWTTEIGWRVGGGGAGDLELGYSEVETPAAQARVLNGFFAASTRRREELGLGPTFAFALRDRVDPVTGRVDNKSGLRLADDTPRQAWGVLVRGARAAPRLPWPKPRACS
jgi:hypothetical protein